MRKFYSSFVKKRQFACCFWEEKRREERIWEEKRKEMKNLPSFLWSKGSRMVVERSRLLFVGLSRLEWWWVLGWDWVSFALHFLEEKRRKTNPLLFFLFFLVLLKRSLLFSPLLHKTTFLLSSSSLGEAFSPSPKTHLLLSLPHQSQLGFAWISIILLG